METPGELVDKASILTIRMEKHPDAKIQAELWQRHGDVMRELSVMESRVRAGDLKADMIIRPLHKLRARTGRQPTGSTVVALSRELEAVNRDMWENEDLRDSLVGIGVASSILLDADRREQQFNQDRSVLIDAINQAAALEWTPRCA